jgi:hypothetical protein
MEAFSLPCAGITLIRFYGYVLSPPNGEAPRVIGCKVIGEIAEEL